MSRIPFFQGLHRHDLGKLIGIMHAKTYQADEVVFHEGEPGRALFIIESGEVAIIKSRSPAPGQTEEAILARLGPGGFFGEMALLEELPRSATAKTMRDSVLHFVYKAKLDSFVERHPAVGVKILHNVAKVLSARLRETSDSYCRHL
jgi:CRP-like cAMP-binding protein